MGFGGGGGIEDRGTRQDLPLLKTKDVGVGLALDVGLRAVDHPRAGGSWQALERGTGGCQTDTGCRGRNGEEHRASSRYGVGVGTDIRFPRSRAGRRACSWIKKKEAGLLPL